MNPSFDASLMPTLVQFWVQVSLQLSPTANGHPGFYAVRVTFPAGETGENQDQRLHPTDPFHQQTAHLEDAIGLRRAVRPAKPQGTFGDPPERILVIVPAFREEASVAEVVRQIRALSKSEINGTLDVDAPQLRFASRPTNRQTHGSASSAFDVLVVDDGSPDRTAEHARGAGAMVASLPVNLGVGAALQTGFRYAVANGYTTVVTIDADGQHPVSFIPALLGVPGKALVVGSRFIPGSVAPEWVSSTRSFAMGVLRRRLTNRTGVCLYDPTSGFRVIREPLLSRFARDFPATYLGDTFEAHLSAAAILGGSQIAEISVPMKARATGVPSSAGLRNIAYFARALLTTGRLVWKPLGTSQSSTSRSGSPKGSRA